MKSSIVALIVFVLGLSATAYGAGTDVKNCNLTCTNGTTTWEFGVKVIFGEDVTVIVSKVYNVIIIINNKTKVLIVFDTAEKSKLMIIAQFEASFGIAVNYKTGAIIKVDLDIKLILADDFEKLRNSLDQAHKDLDNNVGTIVVINLGYIKQVSYNASAVFISGSIAIQTEIAAKYSFVFQACYTAAGEIGSDISFAGSLIAVVFGEVNDITIGIASSFSAVVTKNVQITFGFGLFIVGAVEKGGLSVFVSFIAAVNSGYKSIDECVKNAESATTIETSGTFLNLKYNFLISLVNNFIEFKVTVGKINISIGYSGTTLAVSNRRANIVIAINGKYTFIYLYKADVGLLFHSDSIVVISKSVILTKTGETEIDAGVIAVFVQNNDSKFYEESTDKILIKDFIAALASEAACVAFFTARKITAATGSLLYKGFVSFKGSFSSSLIFGYSLDVTNTLVVGFSLNYDYTVNTAVSTNPLVTGVCGIFGKVSSGLLVGSTTVVFAQLKLIVH